ncbi:MAG TPA: DinB family protein [Gemmatimonadales bacterium]|jgi:uncharacterized damage-inducible protein DinB
MTAAGIPAPAAPGYVAETLALLGTQDPIAILSETPAWLAARIEGRSLAQLRKPEGPGKWSLVQVLSHLADTELAYGWRARMILTASQPPIQGFDQGAWLDRFDYASDDPALALQTFTTLRHWNLRVWRGATSPADLARVGMHSERGPESLDILRRLAAGHDLRHRRQIERLLKVIS